MWTWRAAFRASVSASGRRSSAAIPRRTPESTPTRCRRAGLRSIAVAPVVRAGETLGVLKIMSAAAEHFDDADTDILELMANLIASGLPSSSRFEQARSCSAPCVTP